MIGRMVLLIVALLALIFGLSRMALGHGDAAWIGQGPYKGLDGVHCCGVNDCERIPAEAVREASRDVELVDGTKVRRHGWEIAFRGKVYFVPAGESYGSINESFWACRKLPGDELRRGCVFAPRGSI